MRFESRIIINHLHVCRPVIPSPPHPKSNHIPCLILSFYKYFSCFKFKVFYCINFPFNQSKRRKTYSHHFCYQQCNQPYIPCLLSVIKYWINAYKYDRPPSKIQRNPIIIIPIMHFGWIFATLIENFTWFFHQ
jgi:hypothetical protein